MTSLLRIMALTLVFALGGCEWAEAPLDAPNAEIDPTLLGNWKSIGDRPIRLSITSTQSRWYDIVVQGGDHKQTTTMRFRGYHTDIEGIRLLSLKLLEVSYGQEVKRLPDEGREHRWLCLGYSLSKDGILEPLFLSREVLPRSKSNAEQLQLTAQQLYASLLSCASSKYHRDRFFDSGMERRRFKKDDSQISK